MRKIVDDSRLHLRKNNSIENVVKERITKVTNHQD